MGLTEIILTALYALCLNNTCPTELDETTSAMSAKKSEFMRLREELQYQNLKIATIQNDMLSGVEQINSTLMGTGIAFDLLNIIQDKYKFNYTISTPKENIWGSNNNGILQMIKEKKVDLAAAFLPILAAYSKDVSFSPSLDTGEWVVLMKRPKESATGSGLLAPFTLAVWLLILLSLFVVGPIIYFIIYVQAKLCYEEKNTVFPLPACIWFVYGALLKQGSTLNPITDSSRMLFATWWIFITILTAFYTANLTAFLTLSKFTLPISEPKDIGAKRSKWVTTRGNALQDILSPATDGSDLSDLGKDLGLPNGYIDEKDDFILHNQVHRKNLMFIREKPIVEYVLYNDYKEKTRSKVDEVDRCTYVITKFSVASFQRAFAYSKSFKYKVLFDSTIQYLVESGIIKYKMREELPETEICPLNLGNKERQLRNSDLLMTYEIVGGGFLVSLIIFIIEMIIRRKQVVKPRLFGDNGKMFNSVHGNHAFEAIKYNNNEPKKAGEFPFRSKFITPPPAYNTLFNPGNKLNIKKKKINGREYWVYDSLDGPPRMVPLRTPSALLFQFNH